MSGEICVIGDKPLVVPEPQKIVLTVDKHGDIANADTLPPELLAQLNTPEAQAQIRALYRNAHPKTGRRETRQALEGRHQKRADGQPHEQRDFNAYRPPWMSREEFRKTRRRKFREQTKLVLREQRRQRNGGSAGDEQDSGNSAQPGEQHGDGAA